MRSGATPALRQWQRLKSVPHVLPDLDFDGDPRDICAGCCPGGFIAQHLEAADLEE